MAALLEIEHLSASYRAVPALFDANVVVNRGSVTALLGANGAGKTTLLRAISNMMVRTTGVIRFDGRRIDHLKTNAIARFGLAHVPDDRGTFVQLTVRENLALGAYGRRDREGVSRDCERVLEYFPRLSERMDQTAGTLSGGEQQMLAIGRALMSRPRLLLLDEPSFGLAPLMVREIFAMLAVLKSREDIGVLLVEQNADLALAGADYAYVLETGRVVMEGAAAQLASDDAVRGVYLGY